MLELSEAAQGGGSLKAMGMLGLSAGSDIFLSVVHWFQYLKAMGLEAFSTDAGTGAGGGGLLETGAGIGAGPVKYPAV